MTNNIRVFLWLGLALALWLNYSQWQTDFASKPAAPTTSTDGFRAPKPASLEDTVPQATQSAPVATPSAEDSVPSAAQPEAAVPGGAAAAETAGVVRVVTDVLVLDIDLKGGTLVRAELPGYPIVKGEPAPVVLFKEFSTTTMSFELHFWIKLHSVMECRIVESEVRQAINGLFRDTDAATISAGVVGSLGKGNSTP